MTEEEIIMKGINMTQEDKNLLLKDLSARLPYGVMMKGINEDFELSTSTSPKRLSYVLNSADFKPYLRPMKTMTKDEREEYRKLCKKVVHKLYVADGKCVPSNRTSYRYFGTKTEYYDTNQSIDYLISRHFDYKGLIGKKLALKATKGMYEF